MPRTKLSTEKEIARKMKAKGYRHIAYFREWDPLYFKTVADASRFLREEAPHAKPRIESIDHFLQRKKLPALPNPTSEVDEVAATELELFIVNDADLYRQMHTPINKNLVTKMARGTYDSEKAIKAFMHLADEGAKRYKKEFGAPPSMGGMRWFEMFTKPTRLAAAESLRNTFEVEAELGNYDHLLPKKYQ